MERLVLLSVRRSGTTLLLDCLNKHPSIHCIKRTFGTERRIANPTPDHHSGRFFLYRTATWRRRIRFYLDRRGLIEEFLTRDVFQPLTNEKSCVGFRLTYDQATEYPPILEWVHRQRLKVVHLVRENLLRT